jgi:hypothetical protein
MKIETKFVNLKLSDSDSSQTLSLASPKDRSFVPLPPLDLFDGKTNHDRGLPAGFRRPTMLAKNFTVLEEQEPVCAHENQLKIVDW